MDASITTVLYRVIYDALIEIRAEAHTCNSQQIFHLSDLLHTLPLRLERMERGEVSPDDIMQWLRARASEKDLEHWLEQRIQEALRFGHEEQSGSAS